MNIAIDGNEANVLKKVGIGEYAYQVIGNLYQYRNKHHFQIYLKSPPVYDLPAACKNWEYKIIGPKPLWTQIAFPIALYTNNRLDVVFSPTHYCPRFSPAPRIISIMDLSYLHYPNLFNKDDLFKLTNWTKSSINKAKKIITISNFTKREIVNFYKIDPANIYVTYLGYKKDVYNKKYPYSELERVKKKYDLNKFIIFVGTIQPRKNIIRLIEAYKGLITIYKDLKLLIVGKKGWLYEDILKEINKQEFKNKILYLDYLEDTEIAKLYNLATVSVQPSLYEGFGLTLIEAMACGCPLVISNVSSMPEIALDAAEYINPNSVKDIKNGLEKIIRDDQIYFRENLIKKGLERAKTFSWKKCTEMTMSVIESLK